MTLWLFLSRCIAALSLRFSAFAFILYSLEFASKVLLGVCTGELSLRAELQELCAGLYFVEISDI